MKQHKKKYLYKKQYGRCNAKGCTVSDFDKLTIDHKIRQVDARKLGWSFMQIHHIENLQLLCRFHHDLKDFPTADKKKLYKRYGYDYVESTP